MSFELSKTDLARLQGVHPDLVRVVHRAAAMSPIPFRVLEGLRSVERQKELVAKGASKTMNSRHLTGHAVDIAPLIDGRISWDWPLYHKLAPIVKAAARAESVPLEWGGDWKSFKDGPHWQLPFRQYPKDRAFGLMIDTAAEYTNESETSARMKDAGAIGAGGLVGAGASIGDVADTLVYQQGELTSGDLIRVAVAGAIVMLTLFAIWRRLS